MGLTCLFVPSLACAVNFRLRCPVFTFPLPIHLGGFKGEWGVYCCTCKARAVSGHSEAGARNAEKDGGFTYFRVVRSRVPEEGGKRPRLGKRRRGGLGLLLCVYAYVDMHESKKHTTTLTAPTLPSTAVDCPSLIYTQRRRTRSPPNPRHHASEVPHRADHMHSPYL